MAMEASFDLEDGTETIGEKKEATFIKVSAVNGCAILPWPQAGLLDRSGYKTMGRSSQRSNGLRGPQWDPCVEPWRWKQ